jgi:hypothetical protein
MSLEITPTVPPWQTVQLEAGTEFAVLLCESGQVGHEVGIEENVQRNSLFRDYYLGKLPQEFTIQKKCPRNFTRILEDMEHLL